jgi:hypothetical protein
MEKITIRFEGKLASSGQLHFYEYGRYQYATARFLSTIEHFRRTGTVAKRITGDAKIQIFVQPAVEGSFIEDIVIPAMKEVSATAISTPLTTLITYVWHLMLPRSDETESDLIKIARIRLAEEKERTAQTQAFAAIVEGQTATTQQALNLVHWAQNAPSTRLGDEGLYSGRLAGMQQELSENQNREEHLSKYQKQLENIDPNARRLLLSRAASIVPDMAVPMRKSADSVTFSSTSSKLPLLRLDSSTADLISTKRIDSELVQFAGRVRAYDVDIGVGKFISNSFDRPLNFSVPVELRNEWRDTILEAMKRPTSFLVCQQYLDRAGTTTSLLFDSIEF